MKTFTMEDGRTWAGPDDFCFWCKHCTDIFYDYKGPYALICELNLEYPGCGRYEDETD